MFGFEFQTSNAFEPVPEGLPVPAGPGVRERQTAWRHLATGTTLEGDESRRPGASSDLEFVTPPCATVEKAVAATEAAVNLARAMLAERHGSSGLIFRAGREFAGGVWLTDCAVRFYDNEFHAQAQGTVGVPLSGFTTLLAAVWGRSERQDQVALEVADMNHLFDHLPVYAEATAKDSPRLYGFMAACHLFLLRAIRSSPTSFAGQDGTNATATESRACFDFSSSAAARAVNQKVCGLPALPAKTRILVGSDSPKDMFGLLHRTDFHSMYMSLDDAERAILDRPVTEVLWPADWGDINELRLFPLPYRIDPEATDTAVRSDVEPVTLPEWTPQPRPVLDRAPVTWALLERGPTIAEWWNTVRFGDVMRGAIGKDAASPPPGFRGRNPLYLGEFPNSTVEDKSSYYGMGSFPMDTEASTGRKLAVFEYRDLMADIDVLPQDELTLDHWVDVVRIFAGNYVPKVG
ncbi:hypothetical protein [Parafrankia sp. FMc2]|uniref:hypothetical protein n=1 Tax=Parafrankia sp. FMc2 TaxID=3233196 RepID=UPI0034D56CC4